MIKKQIFLLVTLFILATAHSQYKVVKSDHTTSTVTLDLKYTGQQEYYLKPTSPIIQNLRFTIKTLSYTDFDFKIIDADNQRFQVPQQTPFPIDPLKNFSFPLNLSAIRFEYTENPFDFRISRKFNNATIFSTYETQFVYSSYYIQIGTQLDSNYSYGLGQRFNRGYKLKDGKWTIFNRDRGQVIDDGQGRQTYGYYPIILQRQVDKYFHLNYFRSSNAMDVVKMTKENKHYVSYKVIGGIIDFRFFLGQQSPEAAIDKFRLYLGRSAIPPFWSLGAHQCRWGYKNVTALKKVLSEYKNNDLPLDTIWSDIDYMVDYQDFTIDESNFPLDEMKQITDKYHYIPIIDAGIKVNDGKAYNEGKNRDVYVKDGTGKEQLHGKVWPGTTTFVDFFHPNATNYWKDMLKILYEKVKFSGIWLDMNQNANFCDGPCQQPKGQHKFDYSKDLPYQPGEDNIQSHTIPLNSTHYGDKKQADVHTYSAFLQTYATNSFLKSQNLRPFIISRSHTLGSNKYGFHWTGDNYASFQFLRGSIADNFVNQMWGFQMVGPDICGFGGNTNEQLCSRWYQLATVYPFHRNHNDLQSVDQQPYALGETVLKAAHTNIKLRYSILKHIYSMMLNRRGLGTIFTPLFFYYPFDNNLYIDQIADTEFLVGIDLIAAPIVQQGATSRSVYFPQSNWYNLHDGTKYSNGTSKIDNNMTDKLPLFQREGSVILMQNVQKVLSTRDLDNTFNLVGAFRYDQKRSDSDHQIYQATGIHVSIGDYNDETKVQLCLSQGCQYTFSLVLKVTQNTRILTMKVGYAGGFRLNDTIVINKLTIYYDDIAVQNDLVNPIEIKGPLEIQIPINDQNRVREKYE